MPLDAVDLEVVKASLSGIVQEMQNSLFRTGFSTIVRESQDASCALMNAKGEVVAQHVVLPLHIGAFRGLHRRRDRRVRPRHRAGRRVPDQSSLPGRQPACAGRRGHHAGLHRRRAVRLLRLDRAQERHRRSGAGKLLRPGARDLQRRPAPAGRALPARRPGERRPRTAHRRQQPHARARARRHPRPARCRSAGREAAQRAHRQIRHGQDPRLLPGPAGDVRNASSRRRSSNGPMAASRRNGSSTTTASTWKSRCASMSSSTSRAMRSHFDFSGSADQTKGPANIRPPLVAGRLRLCAHLAHRPRHVRIERSAARLRHDDARRQRAQSALPGPGQHLQPDRSCAGRCHLRRHEPHRPGKNTRRRKRQPFHHSRRPQHHSGAGYVQYEIIAGGAGARARKDGMSGITVNQSNARIAPIEIIESEFPTRITRFELIADSGGAGEFRGGLGIRRDYLNLADARFSIRSMRHVLPPEWLRRGKKRASRRHPDQSRQRAGKAPADALCRLSLARGRCLPARHSRRRRLRRSARARSRARARRCARWRGVARGGRARLRRGRDRRQGIVGNRC